MQYHFRCGNSDKDGPLRKFVRGEAPAEPELSRRGPVMGILSGRTEIHNFPLILFIIPLPFQHLILIHLLIYTHTRAQ